MESTKGRNGQNGAETFCHSDKVLSSDGAVSIAASAMMVKWLNGEFDSRACQCNLESVGSVGYFNSYKLPSPFYQVCFIQKC